MCIRDREWFAAMKEVAPGGGRPKRGAPGAIERMGWGLEDIFKELGGGHPSESTLHQPFWMYFNHQVRSLSRPHRTGKALAYEQGSWPEGEEHLATALDVLTRHYSVGLQDQLGASLERFAPEFGWQKVFTPRINVTRSRPAREAISDETRELIRSYNALDVELYEHCLLYTSPSPRDRTRSRMPSSA